MLKSQHETVLVVAIASSVFFGAIAGGLTSYLLLTDGSLESDSQIDLPVSEETVAAIENLIEDQEATIAVVEQVSPAVVSIFIEKEFPQYDTYSRTGEVSYEYERVGGGTGFFVTPDGMIVTNKHVVSDENARYVVVTADGTEYDATVLAKDVFLDVAFVKVEGSGFPTLSLGDSDASRIGETVLAIGNTLAEYQNSVTKGIISGVDRTIVAGDYDDSEVIEEAIQTDAPISEGNSGGPLINLYGKVLGVNTAVSLQGQSLGFAVPINAVKPLLEDVIAYGRIVRPWLGVRYVMINEDVVEQFTITQTQGALIVPEESTEGQSVVIGSPAATAGLQGGDIILSVSGIALDDETNLSKAINAFEPGQTVALEIVREGQTIIVEVTLVELDPSLF